MVSACVQLASIVVSWDFLGGWRKLFGNAREEPSSGSRPTAFGMNLADVTRWNVHNFLAVGRINPCESETSTAVIALKMDAFRLLSRSTKLSRTKSGGQEQRIITPSSGPSLATPQSQNVAPTSSRKRKRSHAAPAAVDNFDFFAGSAVTNSLEPNVEHGIAPNGPSFEAAETQSPQETPAKIPDVPIDQVKSIMKKHKLKVTWLNPPTIQKKQRRKGQRKDLNEAEKADKPSLFPQPLQAFGELRDRFSISYRLAQNVANQGYSLPTEVQLGALPILLDTPAKFLPSECPNVLQVDLLTVAPTGSGKTLAFMIPLIHNIIGRKARGEERKRTSSAIVLAPTKELAAQIVNEGKKLCMDTGVRIALVRKGMRLAPKRIATSDSIVEDSDGEEQDEATVVKADILVSTPGILAGICKEAIAQDATCLALISQLVLDEADILLDPLFREQTLSIWNSVGEHHLRVSLWSATMGSNIEELARSTIEERRASLSARSSESSEGNALIRLVVGLKDSALPNVEHRLIYAASEQGKLMGLRQLLHPTTTSSETGPPLLPPFLVFTQTIERAAALHSELLYDIPAEAGGISRIAVLHSDLSDVARDSVMTRFRKGEIWVLITTDLLSRGVDFRGVNGVVNYDIPTSSAAYVHRVGRTGRAGRQGGVAVTLYTKEDIPYLKPIANLVAVAQKQRIGGDGTSDRHGVDQWLLDALPSLSKKAKQDLRKHGIASRTARGGQKDPKAARQARISTKAGYVRQEENKRKGAIAGSKHRKAVADDEDHSEEEFAGFE
jgi:ATP-dependent RNA helicase DDX52/ROK1